jgi:hypothetical protein
LIEGPGGYLETNPSTSPEHMFIAPDGKPASVSYSSTMDMSIIKEVFSAIVSAAKVILFFPVTVVQSFTFVDSLSVYARKFITNRFWEEMRMNWFKKFLKLFLGFYQQKLLETVPLWSGYVS